MNTDRGRQLRQIIDAAQQLRSSLANKFPSTCSVPTTLSSSTCRFSPLHLTIPPDIRSRLLSNGIPSALCEELSNLYSRMVLQLKHTTECTFASGVRRIMELPNHPALNNSQHLIESLRATQEAIYLSKTSLWADQIISRAKGHVNASPSSDINVLPTNVSRATKRKRKPFSHEYVPLLEYFFDENAFPSHADKAFLAKKTGMTFRQIHVWFQNRRNRTKKEGVDLKKNIPCEHNSYSFDALYQRMPGRIIPEPSRCKPGESESESDDSHSPGVEADIDSEQLQEYMLRKTIPDVLNPQAPPHSFPSSYPPSCGYNPFPVRGDLRQFDPPQWPRRACQSRVERSAAVDFIDLTERFSKLAIYEDISRVKVSRHNHAKLYFLSKSLEHIERASPFVSKPFCAPLPSFIPASGTITSPRVHKFRAVAAPPARLHVFNTPSPQSRPATLVPIVEVDTPRKVVNSRKIAPLPRRIPKGPCISHRAMSPETPDTLTQLSQPPSRVSSSGVSSESRQFSEASASSQSSGIKTPISSSPSPPQNITPSLSMVGFSPYQQPSAMSDIFAECPPSQGEGLQLDMYLFGHPNTVKASDFNFLEIPGPGDLVRAQS